MFYERNRRVRDTFPPYISLARILQYLTAGLSSSPLPPPPRARKVCGLLLRTIIATSRKMLLVRLI